MEKKDDKSFKREICCFDLRSNFLVFISILLIILECKEKMIIRLNEIFLFDFFSISFCFNFFSGKYWKRNVPLGVP